MNEFGAKKLGEVLAFAAIGFETTEKGKEAFTELFSNEAIQDLIEEQRAHIEVCETFAEKFNVKEIVLKKAESTSAKLQKNERSLPRK
jgi:DNA-binding PadR family transcriptional regulator